MTAGIETIEDASRGLDLCGDLFRAEPIRSTQVTTSLYPGRASALLRVSDGADTIGVAAREAEGYTLTPLRDGASEARGVALVLLATTCYGFAINIAPPLQAKYGSIVLMSNVLAMATVLVIPYALVNLGDNDPKVSSVVALLLVGCVGTGLAYWIMTSLVGRVGSIRASFVTYMIPVVSLLLGIFLRGDDVSALALLGAPITLVGAFLASRRSRATSPR